jgi:hypothetical protein
MVNTDTVVRSRVFVPWDPMDGIPELRILRAEAADRTLATPIDESSLAADGRL